MRPGQQATYDSPSIFLVALRRRRQARQNLRRIVSLPAPRSGGLYPFQCRQSRENGNPSTLRCTRTVLKMRGTSPRATTVQRPSLPRKFASASGARNPSSPQRVRTATGGRLASMTLQLPLKRGTWYLQVPTSPVAQVCNLRLYWANRCVPSSPVRCPWEKACFSLYPGAGDKPPLYSPEAVIPAKAGIQSPHIQ